MRQDELIALARDSGFQEGWMNLWAANFERFAALVVAVERDRICSAIKAEDDYCVDNGDYMLDSDDCIAVARGVWKRPELIVHPPCLHP